MSTVYYKNYAYCAVAVACNVNIVYDFIDFVRLTNAVLQ